MNVGLWVRLGVKKFFFEDLDYNILGLVGKEVKLMLLYRYLYNYL